ncbi:MAG: TraR/DksA C4-type zinc finger protein [Candidatus Omnitrophica bacterium]|nr:TraR/DksA C4-type zinc finger protein [Candidatus Omnitrophota bacterium]
MAKKKTKKTRKKLSKKDLTVFKKLLIKAKSELLSELSAITNENLKRSQRDASGDLSGYTYHMADMASDVYERDFSLQLASGERELLLKIDEALRRIRDGEYGYCTNPECGKKISKIRLKALSHAAYCLSCQKNEEKNKPSQG